MNKAASKKEYNRKALKFKQFTAAHQINHTNIKKRAMIDFNFLYVALAKKKLLYFGL